MVRESGRRSGLEAWLLLVLSVVAGCNDGPAAAPAGHNVAGAWTFTASLRSSLADCLVGGVQMNLTQVDTTFTGQTTGGSVVCVSGSATDQRDALPRQVINGIVSGDAVSFNLNTVNFTYAGQFQGDTAMFGTATEVSPLTTATGTWRATRQ